MPAAVLRYPNEEDCFPDAVFFAPIALEASAVEIFMTPIALEYIPES